MSRRKFYNRDHSLSGAVEDPYERAPGWAVVSEQSGANRKTRRDFARMIRSDRKGRGPLSLYTPDAGNEPYRASAS